MEPTPEVENNASDSQPREPEFRSSDPGGYGKRSFIEPELSDPIVILEATTFFQGTTSGPPPV